MSKADLIRKITCLDELNGYETQAKTRGITGEEIMAIHEKRRELDKISGRKNRRRK